MSSPVEHPTIPPEPPASGRYWRRLRYAKQRPARYLGHNDLVTSMVRALRRIRAPLAYSHGFSPKPVLRFGPPLPVGHQGLSELVDIAFTRPADPPDLPLALSTVCPSGIKVHSEEPFAAKQLSPMAAAQSMTYRIDLTAGACDLRERIEVFTALESARRRVRRGGKREVEIDVRTAVAALAATAADQLEVQISLGNGPVCRPEDVAAQLGVSMGMATRLAVNFEFCKSKKNDTG